MRLGLTKALVLGSLIALGASGVDSRAEEARTYYFQLICGSDKPLPASPEAKPLGVKLRSQLEGKFRWNIWTEVSRGECILDEHKTTTIKFPDKREMQLDLDGKVIEARLYRSGQLVRKSRENAEANSVMMGGDQGRDQAWFIVIRRDRPSSLTTAALEPGKRRE